MLLQSFSGGVSSVATSGVVAIATGHISTAVHSQQPRPPPALGSGHSQHSRSSSNSSISSTALSQDSTHQTHPHGPTAMVSHSLTNSGLGNHPQAVGTGMLAAASACETSTATPATSSNSTSSAPPHSQGPFSSLHFHENRLFTLLFLCLFVYRKCSKFVRFSPCYHGIGLCTNDDAASSSVLSYWEWSDRGNPPSSSISISLNWTTTLDDSPGTNQ